MRFRILGAFFGMLFLAGCAGQSPTGESTVRVESVTKSGFLEDYSILRKGGEGEASLVYWSQTANFAAYDKVVIDPVTVWLGPNSSLKNVSAKVRQRLANEFHAAIVKELSKDFGVVKELAPGTMRVRVALTDAKESNPTLDTISTYIPQARMLQTVATMGSDTAVFVGEASAEGKFAMPRPERSWRRVSIGVRARNRLRTARSIPGMTPGERSKPGLSNSVLTCEKDASRESTAG